ncbi:MAG TPA: SET domain-containing protein-lysine N-methyltransferase [Steroidobacteraceae bacterium]|nr:SET domain-containing protein-lysine N-methyltransferase [Steroidobacteraceae bacterium]
MRLANGKKVPLVQVRRSRVHGNGVFALRRIRKGTRVIEYAGERVSHQEADRRYESREPGNNHTFLFILDDQIVIDAGVSGNEARFINHSCEPNCESVIEGENIYIYAIRTIEPGEELAYDYQIQREPDDPPNVEEIFSCACGSPACRGTMLVPEERARRNRRLRGG